jgi:outer membrane protein assembly factor BamB
VIREIVVVSCPRHVFGLNSSNGELVWTSEKLWVRGTASAEGLLLVADVFSSTAAENELLAIEPTSGSVVWRRQIPGLSVIAVSSDLIFAAAGNNVVQLSVEDGSIVRAISLKEIEQVENLMVSGTYLIAVGPDSSNVIVDLRLLALTEDNDSDSDGVSFSIPYGTSRVTIQSMEGSRALVQVETTDFAVFTLAIDLNTGAELWRIPVTEMFDCGSDTSCGWIPGTDLLLAIANTSGEEKWRVNVPDGPGDGVMIADHEFLIVAGRSIYKIDWRGVNIVDQDS